MKNQREPQRIDDMAIFFPSGRQQNPVGPDLF
jgi:hypothetical protein